MLSDDLMATALHFDGWAKSGQPIEFSPEALGLLADSLHRAAACARQMEAQPVPPAARRATIGAAAEADGVTVVSLDDHRRRQGQAQPGGSAPPGGAA